VADGERDTLPLVVDECDTVSVTVCESVGDADDDSQTESDGVCVMLTRGDALADADAESDGDADAERDALTDFKPVLEPVDVRLDESVTRTTVPVGDPERDDVVVDDFSGDLDSLAELDWETEPDGLSDEDTDEVMVALPVTEADPEVVIVKLDDIVRLGSETVDVADFLGATV